MAWVRGWPCSPWPASTTSTPGRQWRATTSSRLTWSMTTTSAAARYSTARTVSRPGSPGPAPTKATRPGWRAAGLVVAVFLADVAVLADVERVGLTWHAPWRLVLDGSRWGRRAEGCLGSPRLGLGSSRQSAAREGAPRGWSARRHRPRAARRRGRRRGARPRTPARRRIGAGRWPRRRSRRRRAATARGPSSPSTTSASAPTGAEQPASRAASTARSAVTQARVSRVVERGRAAPPPRRRRRGTRPPAHPARGRAASAAGRATSVTSSSRPSRARPARASTTASTSPERTLPIRVSTLPRIGRHSRPRPSARSWAARRGEPVPTRAAGGQLAQGEAVAGDQHVARVLAPGTAASDEARLGGGRQVLERVHGEVDLAAQQRVAQRAAKTPVPPIVASGARRLTSPSVVISTSSTSWPSGRAAASATHCGLGGGERAAAGAEAQDAGHGRPPRSGRRAGPSTAADGVRGRGRTARAARAA